VTLRTATLVYQDSSLLAKLVPAIAAEQQIPPDQGIAMGTAMIDMLRTDQGAATLGILDALGSFVADYRQPKGPLRITVNPHVQANAAAADLGRLTTPNALTDDFGIEVSYAGTVARGVALAPSAAPVPSVVASLPGCVGGARFFVLSDGAWWPATAREASVSGQSCLMRFDGSAKSKDTAFGKDEMMAWTIDGPGRAVDGCRKGDRVVALSDGGWYPAQVKAAASSKGCPVHYEGYDSDEDETLPLKNLRVMTR
jgi:hypothetical protein